ncbi:exosome complex exonuclease RRP6 [Nematocida minor]|uniref:exosome complex exonuclease RRP6 n=1 Tax=Nematocida minor TaxID=1912983 RepID=UPI00221F58E6|nr:exosome complex exonuclease RRP6 [Nematocida minor]KAI5193309.1 exosome complex exonuclease RRP6 [Nematocida minor]
MFLTQATDRLSKTLTKYSSIIQQEKLIIPENELREKTEHCRQLIQEIENTLQTDSFSLLQEVENICEDIHKVCANLKITEESILPPQKTILLKIENKNFILSKNIPRPQINFKDRRRNNYSVEETKTTEKHTLPAEIPLNQGSTAESDETFRNTLSFLHSSLLSLHETPEKKNVQYISTEEDCKMANSLILQQNVIGVDAKKHTFRSYNGFTCYIQVSTHDSIFLFDMIALRNHSKLLTFWDVESIVKVFYKEKKKTEWLRKDLKYTIKSTVDIMNMHGMPAHINSLHSAICEITGNIVKKQFHLVDWRYKPISQEILSELETGVGYLLEIAAELARNTTQEEFVDKYRNTCEEEKTKTDPEEFCNKYGVEMNESFLKIFLLRDFIAKEEDESPQFLMTDRQLAMFIKTQPASPEDVFKVFPNISPLFKANLNNFLNLLKIKTKPTSFNMTALKESHVSHKKQ